MKKMTCLFMLLFVSGLSFSQSINPLLTSTSGGHFNNDTYQLDWSIGEPVTATLSTGNTLLTQGFHQNNYVVTAVDAIAAKNTSVAVYPNPVKDLITVEIAHPEELNRPGMLTLASAAGKVLKKRKITGTQRRLNFSGYPPGIYLLQLQSTSQRIKTFKIIKK